MRAVFLGTPASAVASLDVLLARGDDVALVVTQPDRPAGRSGAPVPPPVKVRAQAAGLRVAQPVRVRDAAFHETILSCHADVLVVVAYGRILPGPILAAARLGAVNVHFSLLPRYRGAAPVQWALACGERETGVTTMKINERLDEGDIYLRRAVAIAPREHAPSLMNRLAAVGAALLAETLDGLGSGDLSSTPQDHERATLAPVITREDGSWRPAWTAREAEGRVRGFDPWPGVWASRKGRRLRLVEAEAVERRGSDAEPGTVVGVEQGRAFVACAGGTLLALDSVQPEGRRVIRVREAVSGRQIAAGDHLETPLS